MEWIIEDVLTVVDVDWEMVAAIFVLELDAVRGVVGIGDFTVYVSGVDGCQGTTYLNDVDIARNEELGEVLGFLEGKHRGLHVILVGGLVIIEGSNTERGGSGTVEIELALGDASEMYVFIAVELIAHEQRAVRRAVSNIERLGKKATMNCSSRHLLPMRVSIAIGLIMSRIKVVFLVSTLASSMRTIRGVVSPSKRARHSV